MKIGLISVVIAGVGLAQYAVASPIRVVVVTSHQEFSGSVGNVFRPEITATTTTVTDLSNGAGRHHLCSSLKNKAIVISNKFRQTFGFPPIEFEHPPSQFRPALMVPNHEINAYQGDSGFASKIVSLKDDSRNKVTLPYLGHPAFIGGVGEPTVPSGVIHIAPSRMHMGPHHHFRGSFLRRIHHSLMVLGPWEGRAVAFVLGCGIGVLLRMVWVMTIVIARAIRGGRSNEDDEHDTALILDAEDIIVPPPQYTDEKVDLIAQDEKATPKA